MNSVGKMQLRVFHKRVSNLYSGFFDAEKFAYNHSRDEAQKVKPRLTNSEKNPNRFSFIEKICSGDDA